MIPHEENSTQSLLNVLHFIVRILYSKYPQVLFPLLSKLYIIYQYRRRKMTTHTVRVVPREIVTRLIKGQNESFYNVDTSYVVLVPVNTFKMLSLNSGNWVYMKVITRISSCKVDCEKESNSAMKQNMIIVQLIALRDLEDSCCIISDVMSYNLNKLQGMYSREELAVEFANITGRPISSKEPHTCFVPSVAETAKIALVQLANDIDNDMLNDILNLHFQIPRYLIKGFMYSIGMKQYLPLLNISECLPKVDTIFFMVVDLSGSDAFSFHSKNVIRGYFVCKDVSTLHQVANQHSYIPITNTRIVNSTKTVTAKNYSSFILEICPGGLNKYYEHLLNLLQPFLVKNQKLEISPMFLLFGPQGVGKREIIKSVALTLGVHVFTVNCLHLQSSATGYSEGKFKFVINKVKKCSPCILLLRNIEAMFKDKDGDEDERVISTFHEEILKLFGSMRVSESYSQYPILVIGTCDTNKDTPSSVPSSVARCFLNVVHIDVPNESERACILEWLLTIDALKLDNDVSIKQLAAQTSGFLYADILALLGNALSNRYKLLRSSIHSETKIGGTGSESEITLQREDFENALDIMHAAYADAIGAPRIPTVSWKDVGGLQDLKEEILRTINMPLRHPELTASGLRRSGLLLYGPPGTGKTLLAKAVATECSLNFLSVKGPELLNMYVGQSEENVREVFQRARRSAPCIIFFDELDSLAPNRGKNGDSGGVMDRVVSQLLAEMDGLQKSTQLFVIGATNRPDLIDPALLRPGRFDKLLYVGVCEDKESLLSVITALTRKFHLKSDVNLKLIVEHLPPNLTGADMYSLCSNAWMNAVKSHVMEYKEGNNTVPIHVEVGLADFVQALSAVKPSVSPKDLQYFQTVHQQIVAH